MKAANVLPFLLPFGAKLLEGLSITITNLSPLILSRKHSKQVYAFIEIVLMNVTNGDITKSSGHSLASLCLTYHQIDHCFRLASRSCPHLISFLLF